jgi:hypothetical protein
MTVGLSAANANAQLNVYRGTTYTGVTVYIKLHTGDPGAAGTANASAVTTRNAATWSAASAGSMTLSSISAFSMTGAETISHISGWDASTSGTFLWSAALGSSKTVANGDSLQLTTLTVAKSPLAA